MHRFRPIAALLGVAALAACGTGGPQDILGTVPAARIKFFNFGVNAPGVNFYANDAKVTAVSSTSCTPPADTTTACRTTGIESTTGTTYGNVAAGGFYSGITPGQYTLSSRIAAATDNGLAVANVPATLSDGKSYSFYVSGIYNTTTKAVDAFVVEDNYPQQVSADTIYVRFVNAISNAGPLTMYLRNPVSGAVGQVSAPIAYKAAGGFVTIPFSGLGVADVLVRTAGATTNLATLTGLSFGSGRVYTVTARGDATVTSSTAATRPQLDNTANR